MCGDPWLKKGFAANFETRPRTASISHCFCSFFTDMSNFVSFFAGRNAAGCPTEYFLWILNKRSAAGATCQCLDRRQKKMIPSIWSPSKNRQYTFKQQHCVIFSFFTCFLFLLFCFFCYILFWIFMFKSFFVFCLFSVFFSFLFYFFRFLHFFVFFIFVYIFLFILLLIFMVFSVSLFIFLFVFLISAEIP